MTAALSVNFGYEFVWERQPIYNKNPRGVYQQAMHKQFRLCQVGGDNTNPHIMQAHSSDMNAVRGYGFQKGDPPTCLILQRRDLPEEYEYTLSLSSVAWNPHVWRVAYYDGEPRRPDEECIVSVFALADRYPGYIYEVFAFKAWFMMGLLWQFENHPGRREVLRDCDPTDSQIECQWIPQADIDFRDLLGDLMVPNHWLQPEDGRPDPAILRQRIAEMGD